MRFSTTVERGGKTATGRHVPDEVAALATGKRPLVAITVGGHAYRTTLASMGGPFLVPLSAENRAAAGVSAGGLRIAKAVESLRAGKRTR